MDWARRTWYLYVLLAGCNFAGPLKIDDPANNNYSRDTKQLSRASRCTSCDPIPRHPLKIPLSTPIIPRRTWLRRHLPYSAFSFSKILLPPSCSRVDFIISFRVLRNERERERYPWLSGLRRTTPRRKYFLYVEMYLTARCPDYLHRYPIFYMLSK